MVVSFLAGDQDWVQGMWGHWFLVWDLEDLYWDKVNGVVWEVKGVNEIMCYTCLSCLYFVSSGCASTITSPSAEYDMRTPETVRS